MKFLIKFKKQLVNLREFILDCAGFIGLGIIVFFVLIPISILSFILGGDKPEIIISEEIILDDELIKDKEI